MKSDREIKEIIIIGSGPSALGTIEALIEKGIIPTIIDVGFAPSKSLNIENNFYDLKKKTP